METVREFTYLGDMVCAGRGCKAVVTARRRCWWVKLRRCGELLYKNRFPVRLKGAVYKSYVMPALLCGCEAWCLKIGDGNFVKDREIHDENSVWSTAPK